MDETMDKVEENSVEPVKFTPEDAELVIEQELNEIKTLTILLLDTQIKQADRVDNITRIREFYKYQLDLELSLAEVTERANAIKHMCGVLKRNVNKLDVERFMAEDYKDPFAHLIPKVNKDNDSWLTVYDKQMLFELIRNHGGRFEQLYHRAKEILESVEE